MEKEFSNKEIHSILEDMKNILSEFKDQFPRRNYNLYNMIMKDAAESSLKYYKENIKNAVLFDGTDARFKVLEYALNKIKATPTNLFLEFGVYKGKSINYCADILKDTKFYGFDSFEGLPEDWSGFNLAKGEFNIKEGMQSLDIRQNIELIKGWYNESLPKFLKEVQGDISFLHIDCDLYSSTKTVFDNLYDRIKSGTIIVFDEYFNYPNWQNHEYKAFQEFVKKYNVEYEYLAVGVLDVCIEVKNINNS